MKHKLLWLMALIAIAMPAQAEPNYYRIRVTRDDSNLYEINGTTLVVQTEMCMEVGVAQSAVLVWERRGSWNNKLVFLDYQGKSRRVCRVKRLLVEAEP